MAAPGTETASTDAENSEELSKDRASSAYLWQGFSGDLNLTTFDLFRRINITSVAFGSSHSLFLTEEGQVLVNGTNELGQLGQGSLEIKLTEEPLKVNGLSGAITHIACGKHHNAAVNDTGQVFCWGSSKDGQCGTGSLDIVTAPTPVLVEIKEGFCEHGVPRPATLVAIDSVACGASHTLAISKDGEVWAWGCGPQLGLVELLHAPVPRRIDVLQGHQAVAVCCGEKHSMALVLRGEKNTSRSSSPLKTKGKTEAKSVRENQHYPSRCSVCDKEIFTYTDTNDMCIIDTLHDCNVNDSMRSVDSTIIEDVSSSSSSTDINKKSSSTSPIAEKPPATCIEAKEGVQPEGPNQQQKEDTKAVDKSGNESVLSDISALEISACDTSMLVVSGENPFDSDKSHPEKSRPTDTEAKESKVSSIEESQGMVSSESEGKSEQVANLPQRTEFVKMEEPEEAETRDRTLSVESDDVVWKRRSDSEKVDAEVAALEQKKRNRSPSVTSVKSLNMSEAMEYLNRQFEDEETPGARGSPSRASKPREPGAKSVAAPATTKDEKAAASTDSIFGYSSNMMSQMKTVTSRAFSNLQSFSMFTSPGDSPDEEKIQVTDANIELATVQPGNQEMRSQGKNSPVKGHSSGLGTEKSVQGPAGAQGGTAVVSGSKSDEKDTQDSAFSSGTGNRRDTKSGTFIEWSREMSAVDDDPTSLTRDSNQRSLRTIQMQQKNLSRSSVSSTSEAPAPTVTQTPVITATDVWVWGSNDQSQLGLGDQLERAQPTLVKFFTGRHVIKLAAGNSHSLALTANSQVFSWGSNSYGQIGQTEVVHVPTRVKFMKGFTAWDIGAGAVHSVFLGDTADVRPDVVYCGKHPSIGTHTSVLKTSAPVSLPDVRKLGWITKVMAGGSSCGCRVLNPVPSETEAVFELATSERAFYNQLIKTSNLLLRPLQRSYFYSSMDVFPYKSSLQNLVVAFGALTKKVGEGITDLTTCIQSSSPLNHSQMLGSHTQFIEAFRSYSRTFSDFLAVGGFDYCTRTGSEFFEKIQGSIRDLSDERDKSVGASSLFLRAMRYPFFRLVEYSRILTKMAATVESPEAKNQLQSIVLDWDSLKINFSAEHKVADFTRSFWETANPRVADAMRTPERRVLRESKTHPLQWPSGGRFSNRLFVLFNDVFSLLQNNIITNLPLETLWVESGMTDAEHANAMIIIAPEERFEVMAASPAQKAEWLIALNSAISKVLTNQKSIPSHHGSGERFTPPLIRHASHTFVKNGIYKDAEYNGTWLSGKVHGSGVLKWPDGSRYEGNFKRGLMHGSGVRTLMKGHEKEVQRGSWKDGKLNGMATVHYSNGDLYEGHFQDGMRFGFGKYQSGRHKSSCASVYIGEWLCNVREGYGVQDDILKGEKYMGIWTEDQRHGNGVMVTLDGMYFEGNFVQNKLTGFGVMISDDNTLYEGDFMGITHLAGRGTLTLPTGDKLEGNFSGTLNEGLKINGTFIKAPSTPEMEHKLHPAGIKSKHFGHLCVLADKKWEDVFSHAAATMGQLTVARGQVRTDTEKAWEVVAVMVSQGRKTLKEGTGISPSKVKSQLSTLEGLEKIPPHDMSNLTTETAAEMSAYLSKAFDTVYHPLGQLMETLVDVFRASYIGVGAHPRLLHHAVQEMRSYIKRMYKVVRILFPALPANGGPVHIYPKATDIARSTEEAKEFIEGLEIEDPNLMVLTAAGLLYPILLPKIYPPMFDLYALYNEKNDDQYWERVSKLNRQSDMGLMAYLGMEQRFWLMEDILQKDKTQQLSTIKDVCYAEAVDMLQQLSTAFSPIEKLQIIEQTFNEITKTVTLALKDDHMWCMDDLFPIFQFVVVRAKIHHLGAEIHMVDDLIEPHLEHGEFGLMFTTLKACYFQIQNEKMPHH